MESSPVHELPRRTLLELPLSPSAELLRWNCEARNLTYIKRRLDEKPSLPPDHLRLITSEGTFDGIGPALEFLDGRCRSGERIFGEQDEERSRNRNRLNQYFEGIALPSLAIWRVFTRESTDIVRVFGLERSIENHAAHPTDINQSETLINRTLAEVEAELQARQTPFLSGDEPGPADILFAALSFLLVVPEPLSTSFPPWEVLPPALRDLITQFRNRPAGKLALAVYQQARPPSQPPLPAFPYGPTLFERLISPYVVRHFAQILAKWAPRFQIGNRLVVSNWQNVTEVLDRDNDFLIAPVNGGRIRQVSGPFILGMDRSPELMKQREHVYSAMYQADRTPFMSALRTESNKLLDTAIQSGGLVDVVNGYARCVAGRTAAAFFGIHGPTEQDLLRVIRSIFHETFLNQENNQKVTERGVAAGREFRAWIEQESARRLEANALGQDVLGRLLASTDRDTESSRWMLAGLQVGAVDTTATVVANIVAEIVADARLKAAMLWDVNNPHRLRGWCWEALRRRPHNAGMLRQAGKNASLGGTPIKEGTSVLLLTVGAMHDPAAFHDPNSLFPDRPLDRYLHFGKGLHQCSGRDLNAIQVPTLIRELLIRDVSAHSKIRTRGPFPDELIVKIRPADHAHLSPRGT